MKLLIKKKFHKIIINKFNKIKYFNHKYKIIINIDKKAYKIDNINK